MSTRIYPKYLRKFHFLAQQNSSTLCFRTREWLSNFQYNKFLIEGGTYPESEKLSLNRGLDLLSCDDTTKEGKCILLKCHRRHERIPIKSDTVKCIPKLYELPMYYTPTKGQLISKQDCRAITSPKKQTQDFFKKKIDSLFVLTLKQ